MFSDEALDWEEFKVNKDDDFTRNFVEKFNPTILFIFQIWFTIIIHVLSQDLQHHKDKINKLKKESYATIISSIISFIWYAVTQVIMLWWKNLISTSICRICLIICVTEAPGKMIVRYKGVSFLLSSLQPVFSDASIVKIVSFLQPSFKLVWSYAIRISGYISIANLYTLCMFVHYLCMRVSYLNTRNKVLFIQRHTHFIRLLSLYPVVFSFRPRGKPKSEVLSLMFLECLNWFMLQCLVRVHSPKQLNTNQQNDKVDSQDPIKKQLQLNNELQNATVHNQASMNDEHKKQMLKDTYITRKQLNMQIQELQQAKFVVEKAKAEPEMKKNDEIQQILKRIHELELELEQEKKKSQMSNNKIRKMGELINELKQKYDEKVKGKKDLFIRIKQLKATECNKNCVIDVILRICQTKVPGVNFQLCRRQLEKIIIKETADKIEKNDLKCDQLMEILKKDKIVTSVAKYKYPSKEEGKLQVIDEAWDRLKTMDGNERVLILGRVISYANKKGHAELCDLDTRHDEEVKIYNPATDKEEWTNQKDFRDYVLGDKGLRLYTVNLEKLISIIEEYKDILSKH